MAKQKPTVHGKKNSNSKSSKGQATQVALDFVRSFMWIYRHVTEKKKYSETTESMVMRECMLPNIPLN